MKQLSIVSLLTLIVFCTSCKKDHCYKCSPPPVTGCKPSSVPCVPPPYAVGLEVAPQLPVLQGGSFVFNVIVFYINANNPETDTCYIKFTIGGQIYLGPEQLSLAPDTADLGSFSGAIAFDTTGFTGFNSVTLGYHLHQRCDCDSSRFVATFNYNPSTTISVSVMATQINKNGGFTNEKDGHLFIANSADMLEKIIKQAKATDFMTRMKKPGIRR